MIKFIIPAVIIFLIILFWKKINDSVYQILKIKLNYIILSIIFILIIVISYLLYN